VEPDEKELKKLEQLGFKVDSASVSPPDFRDIATVADVAEEVARQIGYDQLKLQPLSIQDTPEKLTLRHLPGGGGLASEYRHLLAVKMALASIGLVETVTSSFTHDGVTEMKDPFSRDEPYLRPNLLTGLLKTLARNPYLKRAAFFEIGNVFTPGESTKLGIIVAGYKDIAVWQTKIGHAVGQAVQFQDVDLATAAKLDVKQGRLKFLEFSIDDLKPLTALPHRSIELPLPRFKSISKFPPLVRDITIDHPDSDTVDALNNLEGLLLVEAVDEYQGRLTYRLIFQKMAGSYTEIEIQAIDTKLKKFSD
jgi:phenylalanyl-tRNA synthetase beta subunit